VHAALQRAPLRPAAKRILMASPDFFTVEQAINPWMRSAGGALNVVDPKQARAQWLALKEGFEKKAGRPVVVIPAQPNLQDFVFCANQLLPFLDATDGTPAVVLSKMANENRRPEVPHYERFAAELGYRVHRLSDKVARFEGMGDALWHPGRRVIWGGVGPRTAEEAWPEISRIVGATVVPLRLVDARFYHLDTCLSLLNERTALWVPEAFDADSQQLIRAGIADLIPISREDAANFAGNAHCPDGQHVFLQRGSLRVCQELARRGLTVEEVDTSEFIKSGGSVFCLKLDLPL
jgi:N-dimethylarginine dimethylaminohydrolase